MRITIEVQESEISGKTTLQTTQTAQTTEPVKSADAADGGSPSPELIEEIRGAAVLGKTAGRETPDAAVDGGGAPIE